MRTFAGIEGLRAAVGEELGMSGWHRVEQRHIDLFAEATGDHQWIHVDPERAAAGPFGTTIAHGYLTLALLPVLVAQVYRVEGVRMVVNYGLNRVRFPAPVPAGCRVRARCAVREVGDVEGGAQVVLATTVDLENHPKPACVAETVSRLYT